MDRSLGKGVRDKVRDRG